MVFWLVRRLLRRWIRRVLRVLLAMLSYKQAQLGTLDLSALGESFGHTPLVVPVRGHLDSIKRLLRGDVYIGRGSRQRSLPKSRYCNTFKVSQVGRSIAISSFREALRADPVLLNSLWTLIGNEVSLSLSGYRRLPWRRFD